MSVAVMKGVRIDGEEQWEGRTEQGDLLYFLIPCDLGTVVPS